MDINKLVMIRLLESTPNFGPSTTVSSVAPIGSTSPIITDNAPKKDKKNVIRNNSISTK